MRDGWLNPEAILAVVMVVLLIVFVAAGLYVAVRERNSVVVPMAGADSNVAVSEVSLLALDDARLLG